jgi:uncharacterized protein YoxC
MDSNDNIHKIKKLEEKVDNLNSNVQILTQVFEGIIEQFEKIKQDINNQKKIK